jgi:hypothetical protein
MTTTAMLMKEIESLPQECIEELLDFTIFLKKRKNIGQKISFAEPKTKDYAYIAEWETEDPYFDRETQLELARRAGDMDAGRNIVRKTMEELEAMAND